MIRLAIGLLLLTFSTANAWGPQAHAYLGREGARLAGFAARDQELASSGALLADLDHTLKVPGVVGDSAGFGRALAAVMGRSAESDRWALGWLAHCLVQDPGQGEISDSQLKLYADFILGRTEGYQIGSVSFDPERIRKAAVLLKTTPPSTEEIVRAVEQLTLLGVVEGAVLDLIPLALDSREETLGDRLRDSIPDWDFLPKQLTRSGAGLQSARSQMPPALTNYQRRLTESLTATKQLLSSPPPAAELVPQPSSVTSRASPMGRIALPPAKAMGISITTRAAGTGMMRTTVTLSSRLLFRASALAMIEKLGHDLFPASVLHWDAGSRMGERIPVLRQYLRDSASKRAGESSSAEAQVH